MYCSYRELKDVLYLQGGERCVVFTGRWKMCCSYRKLEDVL